MSASPRISILTPCRDGERYFRECLESIHGQSYANFEHIVADGGSRDGSTALLADYPRARFFSASDAGIYDALNKALPLVRGDIVGLLNCDDRYAPGTFDSVVDAFRDSQISAVVGDAISFREVQSGIPVADRCFSGAESDALVMASLGSPIINAWFFRASVFAKLGAFDTGLKFAGDREFLLRFALSRLPYRPLRRVVCCYRSHSQSMTFSGTDAIWRGVLNEHHRITATYLRREELDSRARTLLIRSRTRDALQGAVYSVQHGRLRECLSHAIAGTRYDIAWPARFALRAARVLSGSAT